MTDLIKFYRGNSTDKWGRSIFDFWKYQGNSHYLEHDHKYIQRLFPIDTETKFNSHAPTLIEGDIHSFKTDISLRISLLRSLDMMLDYYGFEREGETIKPNIEITPKNCVWLKCYDHNQLRITRILRSLTLLGLGTIACNLYDELCSHAIKYPRHFRQETLDYWNDALWIEKPIELESF